MRRCNAVLSAVILVLFLLHGVFGAFQLLGAGDTALKTLAWTAVGLIAVHTLIGAKLTWDTLRVWRKTGVGYFRENALFWSRRISGFAVMLLLFFHFTAFGTTVNGVYRLKWFTAARLTVQLLLAAAVAVHVIGNIKPMLISFGIKSLKERSGDLLFALSLLLLFMTAALIVYYLRWNGG